MKNEIYLYTDAEKLKMGRESGSKVQSLAVGTAIDSGLPREEKDGSSIAIPTHISSEDASLVGPGEDFIFAHLTDWIFSFLDVHFLSGSLQFVLVCV